MTMDQRTETLSISQADAVLGNKIKAETGDAGKAAARQAWTRREPRGFWCFSWFVV